MSTTGTVDKVSGWPEAIALILWGIVALVVCFGIYEIFSGASTFLTWLESLFGGTGGPSGPAASNGTTNDNGDGSGLAGSSPDNTSGY